MVAQVPVTFVTFRHARRIPEPAHGGNEETGMPASWLEYATILQFVLLDQRP
jgi:hypothetical protein